MDKSGRAHFFDFNKFFTTPQIKVFRKNSSGRELQSIELFGTTIHELAHASHWEMCYSYGQYVIDELQNNALLPESWASCVEYVVTNDIYNNKPTYKYDVKGYRDYQFISISECRKDGYTPLFIDCIDDYNQREIHNNTLLPIDNVSGYTLSQIEDVIKQSYKQFFQFSPIDPLGITDPVGLGFNTNSLKIIRGNLKSMYKNPTSEYLDELFDNYMK